MEWFWDQYAPNASKREEITASLLRASEEQVAFFPSTLVITAEVDVLRDEGEAFEQKLRRSRRNPGTLRWNYSRFHDG